MRDNGSGVIAFPVAFRRRTGLGGKKGMEEVGLWSAVAPLGYVAMGTLAHKGAHPPPLTHLCCVKKEYLSAACFEEEALWRCAGSGRGGGGGGGGCSFWTVRNKGGTFFVRVGEASKPPPARLAVALLDLSHPAGADSLSVEWEAGRVSLTLFDDFGGLVKP